MNSSSLSLKDMLTDCIEQQQWGKALYHIKMQVHEKDDEALRMAKYTVYSHVKESHMKEWLEYALQCYPNNAQFHCEEGMWLYWQGDREAACRSYSKALELEPDNAVCHYYLGATYYTSGHLENALTEIKTALTLDEDMAKGWSILAHIYTRLNCPVDAIHASDKAQLLEDNIVDCNERGKFAASLLESEERWDEIIAIALGQPKEALPIAWAHAAAKAIRHIENVPLIWRTLHHLISLFPQDAFLYSSKGRQHARHREWPEAQDAYEKAIALDMAAPCYHADLGIFLCRIGKHSEAILPLRAALERDASKTIWWNSLARAYLYAGDQQAALDAYDRLLALVEDPRARLARTALFNQMQRQDNAFSSEFYDALYEQSQEYRLNAEDTPYLPLWQHIVHTLKQSGAKHVLDIGCGPGQFAAFLARELPDIRYVGLDFSKVAIAQARKRCPHFRFEECTLPLATYSKFGPFDTVICAEVLEHVKQDRGILHSLPKGVNILASVPNFDSQSHIRFFLEKEQVIARYATFFEDFQLETFPIGENAIIWLMQGMRSDFAEVL